MINQNHNMQNSGSGNQPYAIPNDVYHNTVSSFNINNSNDSSQVRKFIKFKRNANAPQGLLRSASGSKTKFANFQPGTFAH